MANLQPVHRTPSLHVTSHAAWLTDAIQDAIDHLKSDDGYELIANREKWPYIVEALMQAAGVDPRQKAALLQQIEALDRS